MAPVAPLAGEVAKGTVAGKEAGGSSPVDIGLKVLKTGFDIYTFFANRADQRRAEEEARGIDARNFSYGAERDRFSEGMQKKQFGLQKQAQGFNEQQTRTQNVLGINRDMVQKMTDAINNNEQLKNLVIGRWGA